MPYKSISDYGIIGDMHSASLVGIDGSIDWACFPRFDSPSLFAAILDDAKGGRFQIAPTGERQVRQRYLPDTNVLSTTFVTPEGELELFDFMPLTESSRPGVTPHEVHRIARCTQGQIQLFCLFQPRFDYARAWTRLEQHVFGVSAVSPAGVAALSSEIPFEVGGDEARATFTLSEGQETVFVLAYGRSVPQRVSALNSLGKLSRTRAYWETLVEHLQYGGPWRDQVVRSFLLLHILMYSPSGAMVAAPTTSLPEEVGGERNWDYRFCWLRDAALTLDILYRLGDQRDAQHFLHWLLQAIQATPGLPQILYPIDSQPDTREKVLRHLKGYRGSRPVRIGNGAARQFQLDVFGEVILSIATYHRCGGKVDPEDWSLVKRFADIVVRSWRRPDRGIWEIRGPRQHFVYSKVMCWVALFHAARLGRDVGMGNEKDIARWERTAEHIKEEVLQRGWSEEKRAFVQSYDSDAMDASNLFIPLMGFLTPYDPRILSTIEGIRRELGQGALIRRYDPGITQDGLRGEEGAFTMLSFWLVSALVTCGQVQEAQALFEELLGYANHLGLFSEMIDPATKQALGNFPQAFSHVGLIHAARNLAVALQAQSTEAAQQGTPDTPTFPVPTQAGLVSD